jgi:hypothetical protein
MQYHSSFFIKILFIKLTLNKGFISQLTRPTVVYLELLTNSHSSSIKDWFDTKLTDPCYSEFASPSHGKFSRNSFHQLTMLILEFCHIMPNLPAPLDSLLQRISLFKFVSLYSLRLKILECLSHHQFLEFFMKFVKTDDLLLVTSCYSLTKLNIKCESSGAIQYLQMPSSVLNHVIFLYFLQEIAWDPDILVEFLSESETDFLSYLLLYLRNSDSRESLIQGAIFFQNQKGCMIGTNSNNVIDEVIEVVETLLHRIEKLSSRGLFPYNVEPLIIRLRSYFYLISH